MKRSISIFLILVGSGLLLLNVVGIFLPERERPSIPDNPIAGLHMRAQEVRLARAKFNELKNSEIQQDEKLRILFDLVSGSFIRMPNYRIKPWDNWILWLLGQWDSSYLFTQDIELLWRRGAGLCLQSSMIFTAKAQELGFDARIGLLTGHVVSEVLIPEKGWRVYDSDLGIMWDEPLETFGKKMDLQTVSSRIESAGFSSDYARSIAAIYLSQEDNSVAPYPMRPSRLKFEASSTWVSWILPLLLIATALMWPYLKRFSGPMTK